MNKSITLAAAVLLAASMSFPIVVRADTTTLTPPPPAAAQHGGLAAVFEQLDLTDAQKSQIGTIFAGAKTKTDAIKADATLSSDQKNDKLQELFKDAMASAVEVLTPDQQAKFKQLVAQNRPKEVFAQIMGQLDLTDAQKSQIGKIGAGVQTQTAAINADTTLTPDQKTAQLQQVRGDAMKSLMGVLTPDQQTKFKRLVAQSQPKGGIPQILQQLDLTDAQQGQIQTIFAGAKTKTDAVNADGTLSFDQKTAQLQQVRGDAMKSVMDVLTADQREKLQNLMAQSRANGAPPGGAPNKNPNQ